MDGISGYAKLLYAVARAGHPAAASLEANNIARFLI